MKTIKSFSNLAEAGFACSMLEAAGVRAALLDEQTFLLTPGMATGGIRLQVEDADCQRAMQILENGPAQDTPPESTTPPVELRPPPTDNIPMGVFVAGAVGLVLLALAVHQWSENRRTRGVSDQQTCDANHDGRPDHFYSYHGDRISSLTVDRNGDGRIDEWQTFDAEGFAAESSTDDNFDGRPDAWFTYHYGSVVSARRDLDFDGRVDWTATYENAVIVRAELAPNESAPVLRKEIYEHGLLREEWVDENQDGTFDYRFEYDPFGNRSERLPAR